MPQSPDRKFRVTFLAPTQWVSNESRSSCASCKHLFSFFVRRHHCRLCGQIFCNACSLRRVYAKRVCGDCYVTTTQMMKVKRQRAKEKWLAKQNKSSGEGRHMQKSSSSDSIKMDSSPESPKSLSLSRSAGSTNSLIPPSDPWYSVFRLCCRADDVAHQLPSPSTATSPPPSPPQTAKPALPSPSPPRLQSEYGGYALTKRASVPKNMSCTSLASICERSDENEEDEDEEDNEEEEEEPVVLVVDDDDEEDEEPVEDEPPSPSDKSFHEDMAGISQFEIAQCRSADTQVFAMG